MALTVEEQATVSLGCIPPSIVVSWSAEGMPYRLCLLPNLFPKKNHFIVAAWTLQTRRVADSVTVHTAGLPTRRHTWVLPWSDGVLLWYRRDGDPLCHLRTSACQAGGTTGASTASRPRDFSRRPRMGLHWVHGGCRHVQGHCNLRWISTWSVCVRCLTL